MLALKNYASEGFVADVERFDAIPKKEAIKKFAKRGYPLVVFVTNDAQAKTIDYRVYDTAVEIDTIKEIVAGRNGRDRPISHLLPNRPDNLNLYIYGSGYDPITNQADLYTHGY